MIDDLFSALTVCSYHDVTMKDKKEPIVLDLDIFIHLMTSAYREGFKAGAGKNIQRLENDCASAVSQFRFGMADMLNEPESTVQH